MKTSNYCVFCVDDERRSAKPLNLPRTIEDHHASVMHRLAAANIVDLVKNVYMPGNLDN